tara:strand:+ start:1550 stop:1702 length:153 start_codon:yes stop_codon:yes gene_type:complete
MIRKIKGLIIKALNKLIPEPTKQELNNTGLKWDNEYSFHPAGQKDKNTVE